MLFVQKYKNCFEILFESFFKYSFHIRKVANMKHYIKLVQFQNTEFKKDGGLKNVLLKFLPLRKSRLFLFEIIACCIDCFMLIKCANLTPL